MSLPLTVAPHPSVWPLAALTLLAWIGWGGWASRLLGRRAAWPEEALLGVSLFIIISGPLQLAALLKPAVLAALWGLGALTAIVRYARGWLKPRDPLCFSAPEVRAPRAVRLCLLGVALAVTAGHAELSSYHHPFDDPSYYLALTQKTLQTGTLGTDPFSERRMTTGLGGKVPLDALALTAVGPGQDLLVESGLGWFCLVALTALLCARSGAGAWGTVWAMLMPLAVFAVSFNHSAWILPVALLTYLIALLSEESPRGSAPRRLAAAALVAAATAALKSYLVAATAGLLIVLAAWEISRGRARSARSLMWVTLAAAALLVPWCVSLYLSSGTPLFPLLGRGYHVASYGASVVTNLSLAWGRLGPALAEWATVRVLLLSLAGLMLCRWSRSVPPAGSVVLCGVSALVTLGLAVLADGRWLERYAYSYTVPVLIWIVIVLASSGSRRGPIAALVVLTMAVLYPSDYAHQSTIASARRMLSQRSQADAEVRRLEELRGEYRAAQESVPPGARILASGHWMCLLDYERNPIWIQDLPGNASPPPGMPLDGGRKRLWPYLRRQEVEYVLLDLEGAFGRGGPTSYDWYLGTNALNAWERTELEFIRRYCDLVRGEAGRAHYRSGRLLVLRLPDLREQR
ncbi:MAG: hypothetical protein MOGMAGMI_01451 [Candidatus Omnitrophica bacterium]|nr:hypothetical protein [Candidatus Omnitrophota bacterium]